MGVYLKNKKYSFSSLFAVYMLTSTLSANTEFANKGLVLTRNLVLYNKSNLIILYQKKVFENED